MQAMVFGDDKGSKFVWRAVAENLIYAANRIPEISDTIVESTMPCAGASAWSAVPSRAGT
jgi:hypothetical protein